MEPTYPEKIITLLSVCESDKVSLTQKYLEELSHGKLSLSCALNGRNRRALS